MAKKEEKEPLMEEGLVAVIHEASKKDLKAKLEAEAEEIFDKQVQLLVLEKQLEANEEFKKYLAFQKQVKSQDSMFRETVKNEMIRYNIPKLTGEWGSITLVTKDLYKVTDQDKVPAEYKSEKTIIEVDMKAIKEDYTLMNVLPAGVEINKSQYVMIKEKKVNG